MELPSTEVQFDVVVFVRPYHCKCGYSTKLNYLVQKMETFILVIVRRITSHTLLYLNLTYRDHSLAWAEHHASQSD